MNILVIRYGLLFLLFLLSSFSCAPTMNLENQAYFLIDQGKQAHTSGKFDEAILYYERSLEKYQKLDNAEGIATNYNNIGAAYQSLGRHEKALSYFAEAEKLYKKSAIFWGVASSLNNIGYIYYSNGDFIKSLHYFSEALSIDENIKLFKHIARDNGNIGSVYLSFGQYDKALSYFKKSQEIYKNIENNPGITQMLNNIGGVYLETGQYEKALECFDEALTLKRQHNADPYSLAVGLYNIGYIQYVFGEYGKAISYFERVLELSSKYKIPSGMEKGLFGMGYVFLAQKKFSMAEQKFKEAQKILEKSGTKVRLNLGLREALIAEKSYKRALSLLKEAPLSWFDDDNNLTLNHTQYGLCLMGEGKWKEASDHFLEAILLTEDMRQTVNIERSGFFEGGFLGGRIRPYNGLIAALSERWISGEKNDEAFNLYGDNLSSAAFYFSELKKARTLIESIANSTRKYQPHGIPAELREKEKIVMAQIARLQNSRLEEYKKGEEAFNKYQDTYKKAKVEMEGLIEIFRREYPLYAALMYPKPFNIKSLSLRDEEVLLEFTLTDDACYLLVITKGSVNRIIKIPVGKDELERTVREYITVLGSSFNMQDGSPIISGQKLYNVLLREALKDISPDRSIIIVPDGILCLLPFEALIVKPGNTYKDSQYVSDIWTTTYAQSATALSLLRILKRPKGSKTLFALGNPIYDKLDPRYEAYLKGNQQIPDYKNVNRFAYRGLSLIPKADQASMDKLTWEEIVYPPLPETEDEVRSIAKIFKVSPTPPDVLLGIFANETNFRKSPLKEYRYLHFATHADLPGKVQGLKEPFLLLGQVENVIEDDGFLTLTKVLELDLNADLVVLSACNTGKGKAVEGEGVVNFARAFHYAGARSVAVSLWEVPSLVAVEYMKTFYTYLDSGMGNAESLKFARNAIKTKYPHPYYWAVFILYGEGR